MASTSLCPFTADNLVKTISITNIYVTSEAPDSDSSIAFTFNYMLSSDNTKRTVAPTFRNVTFENLYSIATIASVAGGTSNLIIKDVTFRNASTAGG